MPEMFLYLDDNDQSCAYVNILGETLKSPSPKQYYFMCFWQFFLPYLIDYTLMQQTDIVLPSVWLFGNQNYTFFVFIFIVFRLTWICKGFEFCCCGYDPISRGQTQICFDFQSFCRFRTQSVQNWGFLCDPAPIYNEVSWLVLV